MNKFFIQMLLSLMVGVSAALGFNPHTKSELRERMQEVSTFLHQTTNTVLDHASDLKTNVAAAISIKTATDISAKDSEKADLKVNSDVKVKTKSGDSLLGNWLPNFSMRNSVTNQTQTRFEVDTSSLDVNLKDKSNSNLNFGLGSSH